LVAGLCYNVCYHGNRRLVFTFRGAVVKLLFWVRVMIRVSYVRG